MIQHRIIRAITKETADFAKEPVRIDSDYVIPVSYAIVPPGSVAISAIDGSTIFTLHDINGVDEVWYNAGDNSYFLAANNNSPGLIGFPGGVLTPIIGVVDAAIPADQTFGQEDEAIFTADSTGHSIAVDPTHGGVYYAESALAPTSLCTKSFIVNGCISLFKVIGDDPGVVVGKK
jgi:hypothetical protein